MELTPDITLSNGRVIGSRYSTALIGAQDFFDLADPERVANLDDNEQAEVMAAVQAFRNPPPVGVTAAPSKQFKRNGVIFQECHIKGERYTTIARDFTMFEFELDQRPEIGQVQVTSVGEENLYFTFTADDGAKFEGFCKYL